MRRQFSRRFYWISGIGLALLFIVVGFVANRYYVKIEMENHGAKLELLSTLRRNALLDYFDTVSTEMTFWSLNQQLLSSQRQIVARWHEYAAEEGDPSATLRQALITDNPFADGQRSQYNGDEREGIYWRFHQLFHPFARRFVTERGYYDFFLISPKGHIFYSVEKEDDFATNLIEGPYKDTGLGWVYREAIRQAKTATVVFSDMESYPPSNFEPAMFMARALVDTDGTLLGVLAMQLPTDQLNSIMSSTAGMGESGETYVIGEDLLMRSNSRFSADSTVLKTRVDTVTGNRALQGETGVALSVDYRGIDVLSAYTSLDLNDIRWAILAEIDREEVIRQLAETRPLIAALLLFLYSLAMWSLWYIRPDDWDMGPGLILVGGDSDYADMG